MSKDRDNPLYQAFINRDYETVKSLLAAKNARELLHNFAPEASALHHAAENGYTLLIKKIIELGIDPNTTGKENATALHVAASFGHPDTVIELINQGAFVNSRYKTGRTALHFAAKNGHICTIIALLNNDANINARDQYGSTVLDYSIDNNHENVIVTLINRGASIDTNYINNPSLTKSAKYLLSAGMLIDEIYAKSKNVNIDKKQYSKQFIILLPRLKHLIKTSGLPDHLLNINKSIEFNSPELAKIINDLMNAKHAFMETFESHIAVILNKLYPEQFSCLLPYTQLVEYHYQFTEIEIFNHLINSYEEMPHFKPEEFLDFLLDPNHLKAVMGLLIKCPSEAITMVNVLDEMQLPSSHLDLFKEFKTAFFSHITKEKYFTYLNNEIDKALSSNKNQLQAKNNPLESKFSSGIKRKAESYKEFIEIEQETTKAKHLEKGI